MRRFQLAGDDEKHDDEAEDDVCRESMEMQGRGESGAVISIE
jgi:hypothetical protein